LQEQCLPIETGEQDLPHFVAIKLRLIPAVHKNNKRQIFLEPG